MFLIKSTSRWTYIIRSKIQKFQLTIDKRCHQIAIFLLSILLKAKGLLGEAKVHQHVYVLTIIPILLSLFF